MEKSSENTFENSFLPVTSLSSGIGEAVLPDLYNFCIQIVNVCFIGDPTTNGEWTLIDAGMPHSAHTIIAKAEERFGEGTRPNAIILTHGHFDHVGAIVDLIENWDVPVYAHALELPYLTGKSDYPPGDPTVDGGLVSEMSPLFPNHGINLGNSVQALPDNGRIPEMPDWEWVHTPGHTPGHISLFRPSDRALIVGDAFVTVKQESLYKVITQQQEISGPPKYFTIDWDQAEASVKKLAALNPTVAITGHGFPMVGELLTNELNMLEDQFETLAIPNNQKQKPLQ